MSRNTILDRLEEALQSVTPGEPASLEILCLASIAYSLGQLVRLMDRHNAILGDVETSLGQINEILDIRMTKGA